MDAAKLERLKANVRIGGKGTPRRKFKRNVTNEADDSKVQAALQKMNAVTMQGVTQVSLLKDDNNVITFGRPAVQHAPAYDTFVINGHSVEKSANDMIPEMMQGMTPEQIAKIRELSAQMEKVRQGGNAPAEADAEIPNLVEGQTFDEVD